MSPPTQIEGDPHHIELLELLELVDRELLGFEGLLGGPTPLARER